AVAASSESRNGGQGGSVAGPAPMSCQEALSGGRSGAHPPGVPPDRLSRRSATRPRRIWTNRTGPARPARGEGSPRWRPATWSYPTGAGPSSCRLPQDPLPPPADRRGDTMPCLPPQTELLGYVLSREAPGGRQGLLQPGPDP